MRLITILLTLLFFVSCTDPTSSSSGPKISMDDVSISHTDDADGDGYFSEARLNFDVDYSSGSIDVVIVIAYQGTGDTEPLIYFVSAKTTIDGTDDQTYYVVMNDGFGHDTYDFTIYVFDAEDIENENENATPLYTATKSNHSALGGVKLEYYSEDTLPYDITFNNNTYTQIDMTVTGLASYDIPAGGNHTFHYDNNPGSINIYGTTSGKTNTGNPIGETLYFIINNHTTTGYNSHTFELNILSDYFFMYMSNNGPVSVGPLYVNYGTADQTYDNISIPNDGVKYSIGYYKALSGNNIRAYINAVDYYYWTEGVHFTYPDISNQNLWLGISSKTKKDSGPAIQMPLSLGEPLVIEKMYPLSQGKADFQIFGVPIDLLPEKEVDPRILRSHPNIDKLRELFNSR